MVKKLVLLFLITCYNGSRSNPTREYMPIESTEQGEDFTPREWCYLGTGVLCGFMSGLLCGTLGAMLNAPPLNTPGMACCTVAGGCCGLCAAGLSQKRRREAATNVDSPSSGSDLP